jgi:hypothetical protein
METGAGNCVITTVAEAVSRSQLFSEIPGVSHSESALKYFTFSYNIKNCTDKGNKRHFCVFHIICFNPVQAART